VPQGPASRPLLFSQQGAMKQVMPEDSRGRFFKRSFLRRVKNESGRSSGDRGGRREGVELFGQARGREGRPGRHHRRRHQGVVDADAVVLLGGVQHDRRKHAEAQGAGPPIW
jgi:hypothetical protein